MSRMRTLKPGFFTNGELADLPYAARIAFAGLWCIADREGRLEDRPKTIKAHVLPHDNEDMENILAKLDEAGFIVRYVVKGEYYIQIKNFHKHQCPNKKEIPSQIPPVQGLTAKKGTANPNKVKHSESTVKAQCQDGSSTDKKVTLQEQEQYQEQGQEQTPPPTPAVAADGVAPSAGGGGSEPVSDRPVSVRDEAKAYQKAASAKRQGLPKSRFTLDECIEYAMHANPQEPPARRTSLGGWFFREGERDDEIAAYQRQKEQGTGANEQQPRHRKSVNTVAAEDLADLVAASFGSHRNADPESSA